MVSLAQGVDSLNHTLSELRDINVSFEFFPLAMKKWKTCYGNLSTALHRSNPVICR